jgi:hypothetical protein
MKTKFLFLIIFVFCTFSISANDLNIRNVQNCKNEANNFLNDRQSYYSLVIVYLTGSGVNEKNQIDFRIEENEFIINLVYQQQLYFQGFTIYIKKLYTLNDEKFTDFRSGSSFYSVQYNQSFDRGEQYVIRTILEGFLKSFGF